MHTNKSLVTPRSVLVIAALSLADLTPAHAQDYPTRHGLWGGATLGYGSASLSSDTLPGRHLNGFDVTLDVGWTLSSHARIGIEIDQWTSRLGAGRQTWLTNYLASLYYYPRTHRTFFVQAAAGISDYADVHLPWAFLGSSFADTVYYSGAAWGATAGVGWDIPLGAGSSLRPRVAFSYGWPRNLHSADGSVVATGWAQHWLSVDVGLVFHPGDSW